MHPDWIVLLSALSAAEARFLVIGAMALAWHGFPRATGDLDVWVEPDRANAQRVVAALREFGAPSGHYSLDDFAAPGVVVQLGVEPLRVDLLTAVSGLDFEGAWQRRKTIKVGDLQVSCLSYEDLIQSKLAAGRPQDLADVKRLQKATRTLRGR